MADPLVPAPPPLPDAYEIECIGIALAAAEGRAWATMDVETAQRYRRLAQAALLAKAMQNTTHGLVQLSHAFEDATKAMRAAAQALEDAKGAEDLIKRLFRAAAKVEVAGRVAGVLADDEDDAEAI